MPLNKFDSCFVRISQILSREKPSLLDNKDDIRTSVRKLQQYLELEKPNTQTIEKYANVIIDLLLSINNSQDDFEYIGQILSVIRATLECDKKTRRPLVKSLIKSDSCSFLLNILHTASNDRGLGQDVSLQIHQILAVIGHRDKRLALKARLFKTLGATINLLRIYSYNAKICPILLKLLVIYAKNSLTASSICRANGLQPLLRLALTLDHRYAKLQKLSLAVVRYLTQTKKLASKATSTTIVRDILAVVFLMDKSQGQSRLRTIKIKEGLLKILLNIVKSKAGRVQFLEANGFYLLFELSMNVLSNDNFCAFVDLSCQVMLQCCPKQQLPIETIFSPIRYVLPSGYDYIVSNEILSADPQVVKDLDDMREKCRSVAQSNEKHSGNEQRSRPKSSIGSSITRTPSESKPLTSTSTSTRPRSSKGAKSDKKLAEQATTSKKKSNKTNRKIRRTTKSSQNCLDETEDNNIDFVEDAELDDENSSKSDDEDEDDEEDDEEDDNSNKGNLSGSPIPLINGDQAPRDILDLSTSYVQFFDEAMDPVHTLLTKMEHSIFDSRTENVLRRIFRNFLSISTRLNEQSSFFYLRMPTELYFQTYSLLAKSTKSSFQFTKLAYPDAFNTLCYPRYELMQRTDDRNNRSTLLSDIHRILYPPSGFNRTVFDFDVVVNQTKTNTLSNDDERRSQTLPHVDHLIFDSRFECGNLRKAIQVNEDEYDLILRPDINTFRYHQWFYFEVSNMRHDISYRFNIINFEKNNSQFSSGMQPVMFSVRDALNGKAYWRRVGEKVSYYKNTYGRKKKIYYTLTFKIRFVYSNDVCYIAYHYPYTYTALMTDIVNWSKSYDQSSIYFRQQILCKTLAGNDCPLLTITNLCNQNESYEHEKQTIPIHDRTYVVLTARVHPGESNASWVMKGIIDYLLSDQPAARLLRDRYIFKIVPMLNPDGVINGCQRCSLATKDLNRQWSSPNSTLFPTIYHTKGLIAYLSMCSSRPIKLFCDFHGHSRQKNFFFYGNDPRLHFLGPAADRSMISKGFPKLFSNTPGFSLQNCLFTMRKQKEGCARIVVWDEFKIDLSYTMETTYNGFDSGPYKGFQIQVSILQIIGHDFCQALLKLDDPEFKTEEVVAPFEDLFVTNDRYETDEQCTEKIGIHEKRRSLSTDSSSSSSSNSSSLSSTSADIQ